MERSDPVTVATFFAEGEPFIPGGTLSLGEAVARHARVLRLGPGSPVRLVDGAGHRAAARLLRLSRDAAVVEVSGVEEMSPAPDVHLLLPVGDRDRMLWLAEKATELAVTTWRPVQWRRSRSVRPRGEGPLFASRLRARMIAALEQSAGARLPLVFPEASPDRAVAAAPDGTRVVLEPLGRPLLSVTLTAPVTVAVGPEGGLEPSELELLASADFVPVSLGDAILRFETAALAALATVRAALLVSSGTVHGT